MQLELSERESGPGSLHIQRQDGNAHQKRDDSQILPRGGHAVFRTDSLSPPESRCTARRRAFQRRATRKYRAHSFFFLLFQKDLFDDFLRCLLLCNSIVIDDGAFKCDSPDELCLVHACPHLGGALLARNGPLTTLRIRGETEEWHVLKQLEFSSERKRMSVLACCPALNRFLLFAKGADEAILPRARRSGSWGPLDLARNVETVGETLREYADCGLRTLVMALRSLDEREFRECVASVERASQAMEQRERAKSEW